MHPSRTPRWARLRVLVLQRNPVCAACRDAAAVEADHIVPLGEGGADGLGNMQGLCRRCHRLKSAADKRRMDRARRAARVVKVDADGWPAERD